MPVPPFNKCCRFCCSDWLPSGQGHGVEHRGMQASKWVQLPSLHPACPLQPLCCISGGQAKGRTEPGSRGQAQSDAVEMLSGFGDVSPPTLHIDGPGMPLNVYDCLGIACATGIVEPAPPLSLLHGGGRPICTVSLHCEVFVQWCHLVQVMPGGPKSDTWVADRSRCQAQSTEHACCCC